MCWYLASTVMSERVGYLVEGGVRPLCFEFQLLMIYVCVCVASVQVEGLCLYVSLCVCSSMLWLQSTNNTAPPCCSLWLSARRSVCVGLNGDAPPPLIIHHARRKVGRTGTSQQAALTSRRRCSGKRLVRWMKVDGLVFRFPVFTWVKPNTRSVRLD